MHRTDSLWSWLVCFAGLSSNVIVLGFIFSFGVLYPALLEEFNASKATTAWVGSLCMASISFFGPVAGKLSDRFSGRVVTIFGALTCAAGLLMTSQVADLRLMFITYSFLTGFGGCCVYVPVLLTVTKYFQRRRSVATGVIVAGHAAGVMIMSAVIQALLSELGLRGAFMVGSAMVFVVCFLACTFDPDIQGDSVQDSSQVVKELVKPKDEGPLWRNTSFDIYTLSTALLYLGLHVPQLHMARYCQDLGISSNQAAHLYIVLGSSSLCARISIGYFLDSKLMKPQHVYQLAGLVMGVATLVCPLARSYLTLMIYFIVFGFAEGSSATPINLLILTSVSEEQRAKAFGVWLLCLSGTSAVGPPFAGFIADEMGSYVPAFYMAGGIIVLSAAVVSIFSCSTHSERKTNEIMLSPSYSQYELVVVEKLSVL